MKRMLSLLAALTCLIGINAYAADDPQIGHWMLDVSKSQYFTAAAPKSAEVTITSSGADGVSLIGNTTTVGGEALTYRYGGQYDGKPNPRTETGPGAITGQTVTLKRIDARTVERIVYLQGKAVGTERWNISKDGKTRTVTQSGTDAHAKPINNVLIYTKQ